MTNVIPGQIYAGSYREKKYANDVIFTLQIVFIYCTFQFTSRSPFYRYLTPSYDNMI